MGRGRVVIEINPVFAGLIFLLIVGLILGVFKARPNEVVVWHWMADRQAALESLADKYFNETGMRVRLVLISPSDRYADKIRTADAMGRLPDIYGMLGGAWEFSRFINSGHAVELSQDLDADGGRWRDEFLNGAISANEFRQGNEQNVQPGVYGISIDVNNIQMVYNKQLFRQAGLDPEAPPRTWEEFIACGRKLKEAGIPAFVSGWGELWMIDCFANIYAWNLMGKDQIIKTIKGDISYTGCDWARILKLFEEMRDAGMFAAGITAMDNKTAEELFANSHAAMAFNGSWCVNVYREINPKLDYGIFMPPQLSSEYPMKIWGGVGAPFIVNAGSRHKKEAIGFLKWLTAEKQQAYLSGATYNLPVNKWAIFYVPPQLKEFADDMDKVVDPKALPVVENSKVSEELDKGIQAIINGQSTPEEVAKSVDKIKHIVDRYRCLGYN